MANLTPAKRAHLLTLCLGRNYELVQSISMARMQLTGSNPNIVALQQERELNDACIAELKGQRAAA